MEAFMRMEEILEESGLHKELKPRGGIVRSHGAEGFTFKSGQRIRYRTRTKGGGRGFSGDTLILDEAMILPEFTIGALLPTLSAKSITGNPQVWYTGSAVDQQIHEDGVVFARIRERGIKGDDPSLAYFEWSAPKPEDKEVWSPDQVDDDYLEDTEKWLLANPALGIRISTEHVENELRSMDARTFAVERLGVGDWPVTDARALALEGWDDLIDPDSVLLDPVCIAYDVSPSRSSASICAAGTRNDKLAHVEVIENKKGTGWVVDRLVELEKHRPVAVLCDKASPAASLVPEIEERGVRVQVTDARGLANACGFIFDLVEQGKLRHLGSKQMKDALKGASRRPLGDSWAWSRKTSSADITPLVASTLALWGWSTSQHRGFPRRRRGAARGRGVTVTAMLAWFDEPVDLLETAVQGAAVVADRLVAADGAYEQVPDRAESSPPEQKRAIVRAAKKAGLDVSFLPLGSGRGRLRSETRSSGRPRRGRIGCFRSTRTGGSAATGTGSGPKWRLRPSIRCRSGSSSRSTRNGRRSRSHPMSGISTRPATRNGCRS
jgi:hypothetical protein